MSTAAEDAAIAALREAARALMIGGDATPADESLLEHRKPDVALEVAAVLDAMVRLLHQVDLRSSGLEPSSHSLHAVVQHMSAGSELARRVADRGEPGSASTGRYPELRHSD